MMLEEQKTARLPAAREAAEKAISRYAEIQLSLEEQKQFAKALINPPAISSSLEKAADVHQRLVEPS